MSLGVLVCKRALTVSGRRGGGWMNARAIRAPLMGALGVAFTLAAAETLAPATVSEPLDLPSSAITTSEPTPHGTRFNLEPRTNTFPQSSQSIDFLPNRVALGVDLVVGTSSDERGSVGALGGSSSGYYVSRDKDPSPEYEGGLPPVDDPRDDDHLYGRGVPDVVADPIRGAFFAADRRLDGTTSAIGLFRVSAANLKDVKACPNGTHTAEQAAMCWPTKRVLYTRRSDVDGEIFYRADRPRLAVDPRITGAGAGNVYVAAKVHTTDYDVRVIACTNDLHRCSPSAIVAPNVDLKAAQTYDMSIRPDGQITFVWTENVESDLRLLKYRSCTPSGTSAAPVCGPVALVEAITKTGNLPTQAFGVFDNAHDHVLLESGLGTYVLWTQCKTPRAIAGGSIFCPDADIVMKGTQDNGQTWSPLMCVACEAQDQFMPAVRTDQARNILNVAYYSSQDDTIYQRRLQVYVKQVLPGNGFPGAATVPQPVTTLLNDPAVGFTERIGIAARGSSWGLSRVHVHFTYNNIQGRDLGVNTPEPNNHLARLDY